MNFSQRYHDLKSKHSLQKLRKLVTQLGSVEPQLQAKSLETLVTSARELSSDTTLSNLAELFGYIREVSVRILGLRQYDVQLIGGLVLAQGKLAEMPTGEGKTLTIAAPCIAAALRGMPVHVVTVNEYLAERDAHSLKPLYEAFGLTVGVLKEGQSLAEKQAVYACSIVYGVNHEFGFDYLRDNMVLNVSQRVQRGLGFVVIDEVDSILIDESRTPLIISGAQSSVPGPESLIAEIIQTLEFSKHYQVNEKERLATFTEDGYAALEDAFHKRGLTLTPASLYHPEHLNLVQRATQALLARTLYQRDKHYVVQEGEIIIVDEATGRVMPGRRWGEGLHEAIEAKENVVVKSPVETQATITYQSFFGLYTQLAGLTGTALTEAEEFSDIYHLETVVVPPNKPSNRQDLPEIVFRTRSEKFEAVVAEVLRRHERGQPLLIGTVSVAESERVSRLLMQKGIPHKVLNARNAAEEAPIIASAGVLGAVTVATNMAGRGTDILLGGLPYDSSGVAQQQWQDAKAKVLAVGGLHVIGTERHENRRIDNQLRGRAGRQGDLGSSQFIISMEDRLLRVFAADSLAKLMLIVPEGTGVSNALVDKAISKAQQRMEEQGFSARKDLLKYDQILASQRLALYAIRDSILEANAEELLEQTKSLARSVVDFVLDEWLEAAWIDDSFDVVAFKTALAQMFQVNAPVVAWVYQEELSVADIRQNVHSLVENSVEAWAQELPEDLLKSILLQALDQQWISHLTALDELKSAISLRTKAQLNPFLEFGKDAQQLFKGLRLAWAREAIQTLNESLTMSNALAGNLEASNPLTGDQLVQLELVRRWVGRNESCPCKSGLPFKHCHGKL